jgi:hypothetical protein
MGNGVVLERGKHDELLSDEDGPYARLVNAQRLREAREAIDITDLADVPVGQSSEKAVESNADIEKEALEEIPLGRSNTHRSLASEILEQRKGLSKQEKEYSIFYLFRRMGRINKGEWKNYLFGCLFSIGKHLPWLDNPGVSPSVCRDWIRLSGFRYCLVYVQRELRFRVGTKLTITCLKQLRLLQAFQTIQLRNAAMLVTATPFGESSSCNMAPRSLN